MNMNNEYPRVEFKSYINQIQMFKNTGRSIGDWLYVGYNNSEYKSICIYNCFGYKVVPLFFTKWEGDAIAFAELLYKHYQDYFILWLDNPQANVPLLTRYTIPDGEALYSTIKHFSDKVTSYDEFVDVYTRFSS